MFFNFRACGPIAEDSRRAALATLPSAGEFYSHAPRGV